jgi:hypothetical protein
MPTASGVAVVATQLARTDRRALSQAWYSALHVERDDARPAAARRSTAPAPPRATAHAAPSHAAASAGRRPAVAVARADEHHRRAGGNALPERRAPVERTARRVERVIEQLAHAPQPRASRTVAIDGGRVTLLVRSGAGATRVVAVCSEPLRATVERALAHARFALAGRGRTVAS